MHRTKIDSNEFINVESIIIVTMSVLALVLISWSSFASIVIYFGFKSFGTRIIRRYKAFGHLEYDEDWIADRDLYPSNIFDTKEITKIEHLGELYISDHHHQHHQRNLSVN